MDIDKDLKVIDDFIKDHFIMVLSTARDNVPYSCTVFYITNDSYVLYFTSAKKSEHCSNIKNNPNVAGCIYKHNSLSEYDKEKIGIQFIGKAEPVKNVQEAITALTMFGKNFMSAKTWYKDAINFVKDGEIFKIQIEQVKMYNNKLNIKHKDYLSV